MKIFVAKLSFDTDEDELRELFEGYGEVDSSIIVMDRFTGGSKGYGYVEMPNDDEAQAAINELNNTEIDGRTIVVAKVEPGRNTRRRGGHGGPGNPGGTHGGDGGGGGFYD